MRVTDMATMACRITDKTRRVAHEKIYRFCIAAAAIGCAMIALAQAGIGASKENVVRAKVDLPAPVANPNLPFQVSHSTNKPLGPVAGNSSLPPTPAAGIHSRRGSLPDRAY